MCLYPFHSIQVMFLSNLAESQQEHITLSGVEAGMVALLLDYAYTSTITITESNVQVSGKLALLLFVLMSSFPFPQEVRILCLSIFNKQRPDHTIGERAFLHTMVAHSKPDLRWPGSVLVCV